MKSLKEMIYLYLKKHPPALELFNMLERAGTLYLIGGVLREFKDNGDILDLRDIDIVIDVEDNGCWENILFKFCTNKNRFGGYKLYCSGLIVDIWPLDETWAYKNGIIKCSPEKYAECLTDTVFLNIDAIVYDVKRNIWYDKGYQEAIESRILDVVLECNPEVPLNIVRAIVLKKRYHMEFSQGLKSIIRAEKASCDNFIDLLMDIQRKRYRKEILSQELIKEALCQCADAV